MINAENDNFGGRFLFTKPLGLNPNQIELNELKTRVSFFLKLDNGKYCPWISLNFRNMTSSGDVIQIYHARMARRAQPAAEVGTR